MAVKICQVAPHSTLLYVPEYCPEPAENWFEHNYWQTHQAIRPLATGRATAWWLGTEKVPGLPSTDMVWRHYQRGGLMSKLLDDQFFFSGIAATRPYQELSLLHFMRQHQLPVPVPLAARILRNGCVYRADLLTGFIANSQDLLAYLLAAPLPARIWQQVGKTIARLHLHQVYHHDLNIKNIMLDASEQVWIIDFDRCKVLKGERWKAQNIQRLLRSLDKQQGLAGKTFFDASAQAALLTGYRSI